MSSGQAAPIPSPNPANQTAATNRVASPDLEGIIVEIEGSLGTPFDQLARDKVGEIVEKFSIDLVAKSSTIANGFEAPGVGDAYVRDAAKGLLVKGTWRSQVALTIGGILLGGGISGVIGMAASDSLNLPGVLMSMAAGLVGTLLIGLARSL